MEAFELSANVGPSQTGTGGHNRQTDCREAASFNPPRQEPARCARLSLDLSLRLELLPNPSSPGTGALRAPVPGSERRVLADVPFV